MASTIGEADLPQVVSTMQYMSQGQRFSCIARKRTPTMYLNGLVIYQNLNWVTVNGLRTKQ